MDHSKTWTLVTCRYCEHGHWVKGWRILPGWAVRADRKLAWCPEHTGPGWP